MKVPGCTGLIAPGYPRSLRQAFAATLLPPDNRAAEIDGSGAVIATGKVVNLAALIRERFSRN